MTNPTQPTEGLLAAGRAAAAKRPKDRRLRPAAAKPALKPGRADKKSPSFAAPRTMALGLILTCFAASGALRLAEMGRQGELDRVADTVFSSSLFSASAATEAETAERVGAEPGAVAKAADIASAEAAMEAAIAAGRIATASTPGAGDAKAAAQTDHEDAGKKAARAPGLPAIASAEASEAANLIDALRRREAELDAYAVQLSERNEALTLAAERLETRMRELERSKEEFSALVATVDQAADRDVSHLISMYEKMKPKQAGPLFDTMDPGFAAGFLSRMKPDRASAIMAQMATDRAYAVSIQLAGRNVRTNTEKKPEAPAE